MIEYTFATCMNMAQACKTFAGPDDQDYLAGYQRGLRRAHHGENFGTNSEHKKWLNCGNHDQARAAGYHDGLNMVKPRPLTEGNDHA